MTHLQNQLDYTLAEQGDIDFFRANQDRNHRLRPATADEVFKKLGVKVKESAASSIWYAAMRRFDPESKYRPVTRVFATTNPLTFELDDEENARRFFLAVFRRRG